MPPRRGWAAGGRAGYKDAAPDGAGKLTEREIYALDGNCNSGVRCSLFNLANSQTRPAQLATLYLSDFARFPNFNFVSSRGCSESDLVKVRICWQN
jgi:hypothetical protein